MDKKLKCGCIKSRFGYMTRQCDKHATQQLEEAAKRLERDYVKEQELLALEMQERKTDEG